MHTDEKNNPNKIELEGSVLHKYLYSWERSYSEVIDLRYIPDYNNKLIAFENLVKDEKLESSYDEMFIVWHEIAYNWYFINWGIETDRGKKNKKLKEELELFKEMLDSGKRIKLNMLEFETKNGHIKFTSEILLRNFFSFCQKNELSKFIKALESVTDDEPETSAKYRAEFLRNSLWPFFLFLKDKTFYRNSSNSDVYRFIYRFCITIGIDWGYIQLTKTNPPEEYLRRTFHKLDLFTS
ncbi:hypothetical protein ACUNWD_09945 [Sunxiuqinia sp. A32]|uniref:hypothetical protein n=1 Tax=Sunxiuqinia sp. A32 TaxID=3461496 RepID=UPI0040467865